MEIFNTQDLPLRRPAVAHAYLYIASVSIMSEFGFFIWLHQTQIKNFIQRKLICKCKFIKILNFFKIEFALIIEFALYTNCKTYKY